jgi:hypothetical protein
MMLVKIYSDAEHSICSKHAYLQQFSCVWVVFVLRFQASNIRDLK